jgi:hypothetical protein
MQTNRSQARLLENGGDVRRRALERNKRLGEGGSSIQECLLFISGLSSPLNRPASLHRNCPPLAKSCLLEFSSGCGTFAASPLDIIQRAGVGLNSRTGSSVLARKPDRERRGWRRQRDLYRGSSRTRLSGNDEWHFGQPEMARPIGRRGFDQNRYATGDCSAVGVSFRECSRTEGATTHAGLEKPRSLPTTEDHVT